jgi:hypothetical protein
MLYHATDPTGHTTGMIVAAAMDLLPGGMRFVSQGRTQGSLVRHLVA